MKDSAAPKDDADPRLPYSAPTLIVHGDLRTITAAKGATGMKQASRRRSAAACRNRSLDPRERMSGVFGCWRIDGRPLDPQVLRHCLIQISPQGSQRIYSWTDGAVALGSKEPPASFEPNDACRDNPRHRLRVRWPAG